MSLDQLLYLHSTNFLTNYPIQLLCTRSIDAATTLCRVATDYGVCELDAAAIYDVQDCCCSWGVRRDAEMRGREPYSY